MSLRRKIAKNKTLKKRIPMNDTFVDLLSQLKEVHAGEPFRARAYGRAEEAVANFGCVIHGVHQLKGVKNIGPSTLKKLKEYVDTGKIAVLEAAKNDPRFKFMKIFGVGPKKAAELVQHVSTIEELRGRQDELLNDVQKKGLAHYEDLLLRIPREEIDEYKQICEETFKGAFQIVGSYRRGASNSGDIDIIITGKTNTRYLRFVQSLKTVGLIKEILSSGESKSLVIAKLPGSPARRVDFLYCPPQEYAFALLYFTGSALFNVVMRQWAVEHVYSMNEHGITDKEGRRVVQDFPDEESIFAFLGLEYKAPHERVNGAAVVPKMKKKAPKKENSRTCLKELQEHGVTCLDRHDEETLSRMIRSANKAYYNEKPIVTDEIYDILCEYVKEHYPNNDALHEIGAPVEKNDAELPYFMGSMDKIKPDTGILPRWKTTYGGPYVISGKLNGVSGLYTTEGEEPKLYTRGDGRMGQDVSHLIPYLDLPKTPGVVIRGELIIAKAAFQERYREKWANPLGLIVSTVNAKRLNSQKLADLQFVAYEVIEPVLCPSDQMAFLGSMNRVRCEIYKDITNEFLSGLLVKWRDEYEFEIDGIIVTNDKIYERVEGNPEHSFAFKMMLGDQMAEAKVVDVEWHPSMYGLLKPRVRIEPVMIGGARIEYINGHNAANIRDKGIGVGAVVKLVRSGDIIPDIVEVTVKATPKMPTCPWVWKSVEAVLEDVKGSITVRRKQMEYFFKLLDIDCMGEGNITRLMKGGHDTIEKIVVMDYEDFLAIEGFKERMAKKIYNSIQEKIKASKLSTLMAASGVFARGMGRTRIDKILAAYPDILETVEPLEEKIDKIGDIKGFAAKTAAGFAKNIPALMKFLKDTGLGYKLREKQETGHALYGKRIVLSGFRSGDLKAALEKVGAKMGSSVTKDTFVLLAKTMGSTKVKEAERYGIPVMEPAEFVKEYL